jgi:DNA-binding NtrC family response regulator/tetratricopeptide (TPR) repeat protein
VTLNLGTVYLKKRNFAEAESAFNSTRKTARRSGDFLMYTRATLMLGVTETRIGKLAAAEKHILEARVIAERRSYGREISLADEFLGDLMVEKSDLHGALENYTVALSGAKKISPDGDIVAEVLRRISRLYLLQKKPKKVLAIGAKALDVAEKCGEKHEIGFVRRSIAEAYALLKQKEKAHEHIIASSRIFLEVNNPYESSISDRILAEFLFKQGDRRSVNESRKIIGKVLSFYDRHEELRDLAESHFLIARIEHKLQNRDECILHLYEAQALAEDLKDRNLQRRLKRMRDKVENEATEPPAFLLPRQSISGELSGLFAGNPHLRSYLDYILGDLMRRLAAGHGFVSLCNGNDGREEMVVLARRGVTVEQTKKLAEWFLGREDADLSESILITDISHDRRSNGITGIVPERSAPVYFHPLCNGRDPFGLIFFQPEGNGGGAPRLGKSFDIVSTYAGFISFIVRGILRREEHDQTTESVSSGHFQQIITCNEKMLRILGLAQRVAESDSTVLLLGGTGTGKGLIARAIHNMSPRGSRKIVHVNCAALPETLLESELFGHVKGSFTGAISDKKGLLAEADGGTIFLDEIGKTSLPMQGKLLQFLDTRMVRPVGSNEMFEVDVRLIFASKVDLISLCEEGRMLEDFYYRINDFPLTIPPLSERKDDIPLLAGHNLKLFCERLNKRVLGFTDEAMCALQNRSWPGNVRELEKTIKRAVILTDDNGLITPAELAFACRDSRDSAIVKKVRLSEHIEELEKRMISEALERCSWNRKAAAEELAISYPTLLKKIRQFDLQRS